MEENGTEGEEHGKKCKKGFMDKKKGKQGGERENKNKNIEVVNMPHNKIKRRDTKRKE